MTDIQNRLFSMRDDGYRDFLCKLVPTMPREKVIGVRAPLVREYAKELYQSGSYEAFLARLPHTYHEEDNLHGALLCRMKDFPALLCEIDRFLPYVDNWATCDSLHPKLFSRHTDELLGHISRWLSSNHSYTIRFGIEILMNDYLDKQFKIEYLSMVSALRSDEYYVNMMIAWYFATALAKQYDDAVPYIQDRSLAPWVHNKAIQKALESYRVPPERKAYLKTLKCAKNI